MAKKQLPLPTAPGLRAKNPNSDVGAAVHRDLYKATDKVFERSGDAKEARTLAFGFWIVFCVVIGGISFSLNGFWLPAPIVSFEGGEDAQVGEASDFTFVWKDGRSTDASLAIDLEQSAPPPPEALGMARVRLVSGRHHLADLYATPPQAGLEVVALRLKKVGGKEILGKPAKQHAWDSAKLARTVPTRFLVLAGAVLGLICIIPPLGVPFYRVWMKVVVAPLGFVNTRLLLTLLFTLLFAPIGIWFWLRRTISPSKDALERAPRPADQTYWHKRPARDKQHFRRWF